MPPFFIPLSFTPPSLPLLLISTHPYSFPQEYTDDSGESIDPEEIAIENEYFSSKALKEDDPKGALARFQKVLELDTKKGEWGFKALKQMLKILFRMVSGEIR